MVLRQVLFRKRRLVGLVAQALAHELVHPLAGLVVGVDSGDDERHRDLLVCRMNCGRWGRIGSIEVCD
jgi:hypothetical protein